MTSKLVETSIVRVDRQSHMGLIYFKS